MKRILSPESLFGSAIAIPRIIIGLMIFHYGLDVFNPIKMDGDRAWLSDLKFPFPLAMAYVGKITEFLGGILLTLGLLTRFASIFLTIDMFVITFIMGKGNIFGDERGSFLFMLFFFCFFILGGGKWSLDRMVYVGSKSG